MMKDVEKDGQQTKTDLLEEKTELRLGWPGNSNDGKNTGGGRREDQKASFRKRGFSDLSISILNAEILGDLKTLLDEFGADDADLVKPPSKAQVVGWPPVRSFRKNMMVVQAKISCTEETDGFGAGAVFVKVSMDGAPYLRKLDLKSYKSYRELSEALHNLFSPFATIGKKDSSNDSCEYVSTYEDKDGDWMLVGDFLWEMFVESCRRLPMMKGKEAIKTWLCLYTSLLYAEAYLSCYHRATIDAAAPRAIEKFKSRKIERKKTAICHKTACSFNQVIDLSVPNLRSLLPFY